MTWSSKLSSHFPPLISFKALNFSLSLSFSALIGSQFSLPYFPAYQSLPLSPSYIKTPSFSLKMKNLIPIFNLKISRKMKPNSRSSSKFESFHKYLKPGALAQLRDSKINARSSLKLNSLRLDSVPTRIPSQTQTQRSDFDQIPRFLSKISGGRPCCLQRKKLLASKSGLLLNLEATASSQSLESRDNNNRESSSRNRNGENLLINVLNNDVVVAH